MKQTQDQIYLAESNSYLRSAFKAANEAKYTGEDKMTTEHLNRYVMQFWYILDRIESKGWTHNTLENTKNSIAHPTFKTMSDMVNHMTSPDIHSALPPNIAKGYWDLKISIGKLEQALDVPAPYPAQIVLDYHATMK